MSPSFQTRDCAVQRQGQGEVSQTQHPVRRWVLQPLLPTKHLRQISDVHVGRASISTQCDMQSEQTHTLMVVVKWTSALAVTRTRNSTELLKAELKPTLPIIAELNPGFR